MFGIVAVLVIVFAAAVFGIEYVVHEKVIEDAATLSVEAVPAQYITIEIVEYDPEAEMEHIYIQSQNIGGSFEELNEIQQRMYDVAEYYDPVEYDFLQEQVDNERTIAKYNEISKSGPDEI